SGRKQLRREARAGDDPPAMGAGMQGRGAGDFRTGTGKEKEVSDDLETGDTDSRSATYLRIASRFKRRVAAHRRQTAGTHPAADDSPVCPPRRSRAARCRQQIRDGAQAAGVEDVAVLAESLPSVLSAPDGL